MAMRAATRALRGANARLAATRARMFSNAPTPGRADKMGVRVCALVAGGGDG